MRMHCIKKKNRHWRTIRTKGRPPNYPEHYELVFIKWSDGRETPGWWTGQSWDGYKQASEGAIAVKWRKFHA